MSGRSISINMRCLDRFFSKPVAECTEEEVAELRKVAELVLSIHFRKYRNYWEDMVSEIVTTFMERAGRFDPAYNAYSYLYTMARNVAGNWLRRIERESDIEGASGFRSRQTDEVVDQLAPIQPYLCGERPYEQLDVPPACVEPLLLLCERGVSGKSARESQHAVLKKLIHLLTL